METAYHEAGHAVVAAVLGGEVLQVTIEPDHLEDPTRDGDTQVRWHRRRYTASQLVHCEILTVLAGPAAELIYSAEDLHFGTLQLGQLMQWQDDWQAAQQLVRILPTPADQAQAYLTQARRQLALRLSDVSCWQAIAEVADLLDAHGTLEGEDVHEVVRRWLTG